MNNDIVTAEQLELFEKQQNQKVSMLDSLIKQIYAFGSRPKASPARDSRPKWVSEELLKEAEAKRLRKNASRLKFLTNRLAD